MAKQQKGRDWTEWKEHITGMHRLDSRFDQPHLRTRVHRLQTHTGISLRELEKSQEEKNKIWIWVFVFLGMLLLRMGYFELTKHERIRSQKSSISRE